jgi:hypothetical protein
LPLCLFVCWSPPHSINSGKAIAIFGSNATLDAGQMGRFFYGDGSKGKTSLEIQGVTLKNGKIDDVSKLLS